MYRWGTFTYNQLFWLVSLDEGWWNFLYPLFFFVLAFRGLLYTPCILWVGLWAPFSLFYINFSSAFTYEKNIYMDPEHWRSKKVTRFIWIFSSFFFFFFGGGGGAKLTVHLIHDPYKDGFRKIKQKRNINYTLQYSHFQEKGANEESAILVKSL